MHAPPSLRLRSGIAALVAIAGVACVYDPDHRCGPDEEFIDGYCVCPAGKVAMAGGACVACGANETAKGGKCVCAAGYARATPDAACTPSVGLGDDCDTAAKACATAAYPVCHATRGTAGYCTKGGCTTDAECPTSYACRQENGASHCARPPIGEGKTCNGDADCAGTEATFCESSQLKQCLVEGCDPGAAASCSSGHRCCDLTKLGLAKTLCLPTTVCP